MNLAEKLYDDDEINDKIEQVNFMVFHYNNSSTATGTREDEEGHLTGSVADLMNLWWYSLGDDRVQYEYILERIEDQTWSINERIRDYNKSHKDGYHINTVDYLDALYPYNEEYTYGAMKAWYDTIIERYKDTDGEENIFPQKIRR